MSYVRQNTDISYLWHIILYDKLIFSYVRLTQSYDRHIYLVRTTFLVRSMGRQIWYLWVCTQTIILWGQINFCQQKWFLFDTEFNFVGQNSFLYTKVISVNNSWHGFFSSYFIRFLHCMPWYFNIEFNNIQSENRLCYLKLKRMWYNLPFIFNLARLCRGVMTWFLVNTEFNYSFLYTKVISVYKSDFCR